MKSNFDPIVYFMLVLACISIIILAITQITNTARFNEIERELSEIKGPTHTIEYGEYGIIEDGISFPYARMPASVSDPE